jgi:ATP-dependent DNA helicase PIF1
MSKTRKSKTQIGKASSEISQSEAASRAEPGQALGDQPETTSSLSICQDRAWQALIDGGENIFLTGGAGTGKSYLIRQFLARHDARLFPVLASTGAAAVLVGGRTFHSFFGLGILDGGPAATVERAARNRQVVRRLRQIQGFVVDEVSMLAGPVLRVAEVIARRVRDSELPWGGLRVIAVGDFAQLPPVERDSNRGGGWAFNDAVWDWSKFQTHWLRTQIRCRDEEYMRVLAKVRDGRVDDEVAEYLNARTGPIETEFEGTRLFPRRDQTEKFNEMRLADLAGESTEFPTIASGDARGIETLMKQAPIREVLRLKVGALVMLRQNDPIGRFVNGSTGHVRKIQVHKLSIELLNGRRVELERATFSLLDADGDPVATLTNFPVTLAWASTIHKAQGSTLDRMAVDLSRLWEPGQAYVALSRLVSGADLRVARWDASSIKTDPQVVEFYSRFAELAPDAVL